MLRTLAIVPLSLCSVRLAIAQSNSFLPTVDLGYEVHRAFLYNSSGGFYNFSNIRYAQPPVGDLRFRAPVPPEGHSDVITDGGVGRICPQANPAWELIAAEFDPDYLTRKPFNVSSGTSTSMGGASQTPPQDPRTNEDCLFLDVVVPQDAFHGRSNATHKRSAGAPVLVWIYGGGYTAGEKSAYNAAGLIKASQQTDALGAIFVSLNYRLGAFGWLSGPTLQSDGVANAGLYDQRLALQWVQDHIGLFGGDPSRVTVIGQSAGGGSIMHQITAFGGLKGPAPFQQAILQSPGFQNVASYEQQEQTLDTFLGLLNVSTLEEVRRLPFEQVQAANVIQVGLNSSYGLFTYGPVVDGLFAPAVPGKLLLQGSYDRTLRVMLGHNSDEGLLFTNPAISNDTAYDDYLRQTFPTIRPDIANYVETVLYPPKMSGLLGTSGYLDEIGRVVLTISESTFTCNTYYLDRAFGNQTYAYQFSVPPALHGQDVPYTFFNGPNTAVQSDATALALQEYITSFVIQGEPHGEGLPMFPLYGNNSDIIDLNVTSITQMMDPVANSRCLWWQKELYA